METGKWQERSKRLESGRVIRWRERELSSGEVERIFEDGETRNSEPTAANVRDT